MSKCGFQYYKAFGTQLTIKQLITSIVEDEQRTGKTVPFTGRYGFDHDDINDVSMLVLEIKEDTE